MQDRAGPARSRSTLLLPLAVVLACGELPVTVDDLYPSPLPGRPPGAHFIATPAGDVSVRDGNLLVERLDLLVHTHLGPIRVGQTWNAAGGVWIDWLDLRYDGASLVDEHGTRLHGRGFEGSRWVPIDDTTLRTRGGRVYRFEADVLASIEAPHPEGAALILERDGEGRLLRIVQRRGIEDVVLEVHHEAWGTYLESYGRTVRRLLDGAGRVVAVQDAAAVEVDGPERRYVYGPQGALGSIVDPTGEPVDIEYRAGRVSRVAQADESHEFAYRFRNTAVPYERFGVTHAGPTGAVTEYRHDGAGHVTWRRDPDGAVWRAGYFGDLVGWVEDPLGHRTSYEYRGGDVTARIGPDGGRETWEPAPGAWNAARPDETPWREHVDARGGVWSREFDEFGRAVAATDPAGERHEFEYRGGELGTVRLPGGFETCLGRDSAHGFVDRVDPGCTGKFHLIARTEAGLVIPTEDGGTQIRDGSGRLREIRHPGPTSTSPYRFVLERDPAGRLTAIANPYGGRTELERDGAGRVVAVREHVLDENDLENGFSGATWVEETIERDRAGRIVGRTRPDGVRIELERDPVGRVILLRYLDPRERELAWVRIDRDRSGRVVGVDDSREAGSTEIERDPLGRATRIHYPHGEWIEQEVDPAGDPVRVDLYGPDGAFLRRFEWVVDAAGRPLEVLENGRIVVEIGHGSDATVVRFANGITETRRFDPMGRLVELVLGEDGEAPLREHHLSYWRDGSRPTQRLMSVSDRTGSDGSTGFAYDTAGRLSYWSGDEIHSLSWDVLGNLRHREWGTGPETTSAGVVYSEFGTRMRSAGAHLVEQDALGRVTQIGDTTIEWEPFDRPRRIGATELRYSTLGVPVSRTIDGEATHFLFGGLVEAGPDMRPRTVVLGDVRIDLVDGTHEYLHRDARQNVAWVTDERGALVLARRFGPFGTRLVEGESRSLRGFAGGEELGPLVRIGARLHFPLAARFLSRDPLPGLGNRYTYAGGDPVNFWDPDGLTRTEVRRSARARFIIRPITGAEIELREEIIVDDPSAGSDDPGEDADPAAAPGAPSPGLFPEVPNHPAIPDVMLPPRFGGCDAIASSQGRVLGLLIALPFLILARSSPARRGRRGG